MTRYLEVQVDADADAAVQKGSLRLGTCTSRSLLASIRDLNQVALNQLELRFRDPASLRVRTESYRYGYIPMLYGCIIQDKCP